MYIKTNLIITVDPHDATNDAIEEYFYRIVDYEEKKKNSRRENTRLCVGISTKTDFA